MEKHSSKLPPEWVQAGWQDKGTYLIGPPVGPSEVNEGGAFRVEGEFYPWLIDRIAQRQWDVDNVPLQGVRPDGANRRAQMFRFGQIHSINDKGKFKIFLGNIGADILKLVDKIKTLTAQALGTETQIATLKSQLTSVEAYVNGLETKLAETEAKLEACQQSTPNLRIAQMKAAIPQAPTAPGSSPFATPNRATHPRDATPGFIGQLVIFGVLLGVAITALVLSLLSHFGGVHAFGGFTPAHTTPTAILAAPTLTQVAQTHSCANPAASYTLTCAAGWSATPLEGAGIAHGAVLSSPDFAAMLVALPLTSANDQADDANFFSNYLQGLGASAIQVTTDVSSTTAGQNTWDSLTAFFTFNAQPYHGVFYRLSGHSPSFFIVTLAPNTTFDSLQSAFHFMLASVKVAA